MAPHHEDDGRYEARRADLPGSPFWIVWDRDDDCEHDPAEEEEREAGGPFDGDGWSEAQARAIVACLNERDEGCDECRANGPHCGCGCNSDA